MKPSRIIIICYLIGLVPLLASSYLLSWNTTQALWENPDLIATAGPPENWPYELQLKHTIILYPYQTLGITILVCSLTAFYLTPTISSLIVKEATKNVV